MWYLMVKKGKLKLEEYIDVCEHLGEYGCIMFETAICGSVLQRALSLYHSQACIEKNQGICVEEIPNEI